MHSAVAGVHGVSSAVPSILFLLTCDSSERVHRKGIEQNGHSNQETDCVFPMEGSSPAATKLFGKVTGSLGGSTAS